MQCGLHSLYPLRLTLHGPRYSENTPKSGDNGSVSLSGVYITTNGGAYWTQIGLRVYYLFALNSTETTESGSLRNAMIAAQTVTGYSGAALVAVMSSCLSATSTAGTGFVNGRNIIAACDRLGKEIWPLVRAHSQLAEHARELVAMLLPYAENAAARKSPGASA